MQQCESMRILASSFQALMKIRIAQVRETHESRTQACKLAPLNPAILEVKFSDSLYEADSKLKSLSILKLGGVSRVRGRWFCLSVGLCGFAAVFQANVDPASESLDT